MCEVHATARSANTFLFHCIAFSPLVNCLACPVSVPEGGVRLDDMKDVGEGVIISQSVAVEMSRSVGASSIYCVFINKLASVGAIR